MPLVQRGATFGLITAVGLPPGAHLAILVVDSWFAAPVALACLVAYLWQGRFRTSVTPDGIEIRGYFTHFIKWRDVKTIEMRSYGPNAPIGRTFESTDWRRRGLVATSGKMSRLAAAYVLRQRRRTLLVRAPLVANWQHDPYFETKINIIRSMMTACTAGALPL
ncbi:MAG TPA: hypothetical protein VHJ18_14820 [Streptosporangiaceae bacterium]|nr:hypothetical protein [Streptosporangiaceae bacterium]